MNRKLLILIPSIAVAAAGLALVLGMQSISTAESASCNPESISSIQNPALSDAKLPLASSLPDGYELQAIDDSYHVLTIYYSDREICTPSQLVEELSSGSILLQISSNPELIDEEKIANETAANLEKDTNGLVKPMVIEISGHKAIAWDQYEGKNIVMNEKGEVIQEEPLSMPARVTIFDSKGDKVYSLAAIKPLDSLITVAQSIYIS